MGDKQGIDSRLDVLRKNYAKQLPEKISRLKELFAKLDESKRDMEKLKEFHSAAHKLTGSGATFGFDVLSRTASELEVFLKTLLDKNEPPSDEHTSRIRNLLDAVTQSSLQPNKVFSITKKISASSPDNRLIFVVDDDADIAEVIALQLANFGYEARIFDDVKKIPAAFEESTPAAVLMDIMYPDDKFSGMRIMEMTQKLCEKPVPVIFMSNRDDTPLRLGAIRAGGRAYFTKPLNVSALMDTLDMIVTPFAAEPYRVLIVEDSLSLAEHYSLILQKAGMETTVVTEPMKALDALIELKPELILMDIYMPVCNGMELAAIIRQQEAYVNIPIVFLSSETRMDKQLAAMRLGGDDFLTKPIEPEYLISSVAARAQRHRALRSLMVRDSLTGLLNHTALLEQLDTEISRAERKITPLIFAMLDIDHFKSVNDTYGHPMGDRVLKSLSHLLKKRLRKTDIVGRYGGEEFALVLPETKKEDAVKVLNELREGFSHVNHFHGDKEFTVTFSCGIAVFPDFFEAQKLVDAADKALYQAKRAGRNRIIVSTDPS